MLHALYELDRLDYTALRLIYWHGRTQDQVATDLGLPLGTIRTAVAHGMSQLADRLCARQSGPVS